MKPMSQGSDKSYTDVLSHPSGSAFQTIFHEEARARAVAAKALLEAKYFRVLCVEVVSIMFFPFSVRFELSMLRTPVLNVVFD